MEREIERKKQIRQVVAASLMAALLAISVVNAATVIFQKTVQITVGEPITLSNPNWLPASQTVNPGQNVNYTVNLANTGPNPYTVSITLNLVSNGPKGTARLYLNGTNVIAAFFNGNSTSKTYVISPFSPGTVYSVRLNLDIPPDSAGGNLNMTVVVSRV